MMRTSLQKRNMEKSTKIDSPLVRYNSLNQAVCRICKVALTADSDVLWKAHCNLRAHKINLLKLKKAKMLQEQKLKEEQQKKEDEEIFKKPMPMKRKRDDTDEASGPLPEGFFDGEESRKHRKTTETVETTETPEKSDENAEGKNGEVLVLEKEADMSVVTGTVPVDFFDHPKDENSFRRDEALKIDRANKDSHGHVVLNSKPKPNPVKKSEQPSEGSEKDPKYAIDEDEWKRFQEQIGGDAITTQGKNYYNPQDAGSDEEDAEEHAALSSLVDLQIQEKDRLLKANQREKEKKLYFEESDDSSDDEDLSGDDAELLDWRSKIV